MSSQLQSCVQIDDNECGSKPPTGDAIIPLNENGGVLISKEEMATAFGMLDIDGSGSISISNLKKRLGVFFPDLTAKEYRFMMNNKKELTLDDLHEMLDSNDISNFDPVEEAFKLYDIENEGSINKNRLRDIFETYGFDGITKEDVDILAKAADIDGDGKVTISDFRKMMESVNDILNSHSVQQNA